MCTHESIAGAITKLHESLGPELFDISLAWIIDTGAAKHMTNDKALHFIRRDWVCQLTPQTFDTANDKTTLDTGVEVRTVLSSGCKLRIWLANKGLDLISTGLLQADHGASFFG